MNIAFVIPSDSVNFEPFRNIPLNVLYLATLLENRFKNDVKISVIDLRGVPHKSCLYYVDKNDIFLYSLTTLNYPETIKMVDEIKSIYPNSKHIAGGIHVDLYSENCLKHFDSICIGEGDEVVVNIIDDYLKNTPQRIYKETRLLDINQFPYALRKFLPIPAIVGKNVLNGVHKNLLGTAALFSRGCCFKCDFCANLIQSNTRYRSLELIVGEIEYLKKEYGIECLAIKDDTILSPNVKKSESILNAITQTNIKWRGNCRANGIKKETIKMAKDSGCVDLAVGLESVNQQVLKNINKRLDLNKAKEFFSNLKECDIGIRLNLIIGLPGEPKTIVDDTINVIKDIHPSSVLLSILTPIPGSEMYKNPKKFGIILDKNVGFDRLINVFDRFGNGEETKMAFEYEKATPFGESMTNEEIINNYNDIQSFLKENSYNF